MRVQTGDAAVQAHQERWDCWERESNKVPACVAMAKSGPLIDADYCDAAVATCKAIGMHDKVVQTDERFLVWDRIARLLRMVLIASAACSLLWFGLVRLFRRTPRSTES